MSFFTQSKTGLRPRKQSWASVNPPIYLAHSVLNTTEKVNLIGVLMSQQIFRFDRVQTVNINPEPAQSKDEILKFRVEPRLAEKIKAFCFGRRITISDYVRQHLQLDPAYFDFVAALNEYQAELLPLVRMLAGKR